jgi:hypothetical protein
MGEYGTPCILEVDQVLKRRKNLLMAGLKCSESYFLDQANGTILIPNVRYPDQIYRTLRCQNHAYQGGIRCQSGISIPVY